jgi:hypothetical protein
VVKEHFKEVILEDQELFDSEKGVQGLLELVPDDALRSDCQKAIDGAAATSAERWKAFVHTVQLHNQEDTKVGVSLSISIQEKLNLN